MTWVVTYVTLSRIAGIAHPNWNVCGKVPSKKEKVGTSGIMTEPVLTGAQLWTLDGKGKACSVNAG